MLSLRQVLCQNARRGRAQPAESSASRVLHGFLGVTGGSSESVYRCLLQDGGRGLWQGATFPEALVPNLVCGLARDRAHKRRLVEVLQQVVRVIVERQRAVQVGVGPAAAA